MNAPNWQRYSERYSERYSARSSGAHRVAPLPAEIDRRPETETKTVDRRDTSTAAFASPSKTFDCKHQTLTRGPGDECLQGAPR